MFHKVCEKIVLNGISNGYIETEKEDEYIYGMNMFFNVCLNVISIIIIGIVTNSLWESIVFCTSYRLIRKYTGGFHFENGLHCYIFSCIVYFAVVIIINYIPFEICASTIMVIVASILIWFISPVEAIKKPLDESEKKVFGKKARISIIVMFLLYIAFLFINAEISEVIAISIVLSMFFAVAGQLKLLMYSEKNRVT